jgi:hypothetical protein
MGDSLALVHPLQEDQRMPATPPQPYSPQSIIGQLPQPLSAQGVGGKAYFLDQMTRLGLPVPCGLILQTLPNDEKSWKALQTQITELMGPDPHLAVRSSAADEDSKGTSFAGQNLSRLQVSLGGLQEAIEACFYSNLRPSSQAYSQHFGRSENAPMTLVIQKMIQPLYSGVYFERDPLLAKGSASAHSATSTTPPSSEPASRSLPDLWVVELIPGTGEALVSGHQTPKQYRSEHLSSPLPLAPPFEDRSRLKAIVDSGKKISVH